MTRNVVVTGMGVVSPLGNDVKSYWDGLREGRCAIIKREYQAAEKFSLTVPVAPIDDIDDTIKGLGRDMLRADRFSQLAVIAADEAIKNSGIEFDEALGARTACIIGTGIGGQTTLDDGYQAMLCRMVSYQTMDQNGCTFGKGLPWTALLLSVARDQT